MDAAPPTLYPPTGRPVPIPRLAKRPWVGGQGGAARITVVAWSQPAVGSSLEASRGGNRQRCRGQHRRRPAGNKATSLIPCGQGLALLQASSRVKKEGCASEKEGVQRLAVAVAAPAPCHQETGRAVTSLVLLPNGGGTMQAACAHPRPHGSVREIPREAAGGSRGRVSGSVEGGWLSARMCLFLETGLSEVFATCRRLGYY